MAAQQIQMIFQTLLPSRLTNRPPKQIRRALSDREIEAFDKRGVQVRGVLGVPQRLFPSPGTSEPDSSLHLHHAIVATCLDHLAVETSGSKDAPDLLANGNIGFIRQE